MFSPTYINQKDEQTLKKLLRTELRGTILDVGCGNGHAKKYLAPNTTYLGIDADAGEGVDVIGDVHALPFADNSFDGVICTAVLEHVRDAEKVASEIFRVLKPGGKVVTTIPFVHHYHKDPEDYRRLSHVGLTKLLADAGFNDVRTFINYGIYTVVEYAFFCVLVHARRENLFRKKWYLFLYYLIIGFFFIFFKAINYLIGPLQHSDTSMYVGVAAIGKK